MSVYGNKINCYSNDPYISAINEAFVGKSSTLLEIENAIGELRNSKNGYYSDINRSKEVLKINRLFEKQFGCKLFVLKIYKSDVPNGYTEPFALNLEIAKSVDLTKIVEATAADGYRFKQPNEFCIIVNMAFGLFNNPNYTNGEIVAIILHEVGHNFADCLYDRIRFANIDIIYKIDEYYKAKIACDICSFAIISLIKDIKKYNEFKSVNAKYKNNDKEQKKIKNPFRGIITGITGKLSDFADYVSELITRQYFGKEYADALNKATSKKKSIEANKDSIDKQNEVFADKFAGVYGYGPEQASALYKMTMERSKADIKSDNTPGNDALNKALLKVHKIDCHPQLVQRAREELKLLEREVAKDDCDPKLKEIMIKQIDQLNKMIDDMCDSYNKLTKNEKMKAEYNEIINKEDPDAISEKLEKAIEEALDKLIDEDKKKNKK